MVFRAYVPVRENRFVEDNPIIIEHMELAFINRERKTHGRIKTIWTLTIEYNRVVELILYIIKDLL